MRTAGSKAFEKGRLPSRHLSLIQLWILLGVLLASELLILSLRFDFPANSAFARGHFAFLLPQPGRICGFGIPSVLATLTFGWPQLRQLWVSEGRGPFLEAGRLRGWMILGHFVALAAFAALSRPLSEHYERVSGLPIDGLTLAWIVAGGLLVVFWALAALPLSVWKVLLWELRWPLAAGFVVGIAALGLGQLIQPFWHSLGWVTLQSSTWLLGLFHHDLVYIPEKLILGTPRFQVVVAPQCSGFEGVGLLAVVLGGYLWYCRGDHRFPQALVLVPIGLVLSWIANVLRIALLVEIGHYISPQLAYSGFHSVAGWIAFNAVALGLILAARRTPWLLATNRQEASAPAVVDTTAAHLVPLMVLVATMMLTSAISSGVDQLYVLRFLATGAALFFYRRDYFKMSWRPSWWAVLTGAVVFAVWRALEPMGPAEASAGRELAASMFGLGKLGSGLWIAGRIAGSVITVPIAEELAFRGYLTRRLIAADFESISPGSFAWPAFLISSVLFGALHGRWVAGTLAGLLFALVYYRRGRIGEAVFAHAVANALIAFWVLARDEWSLWC
jgi:exosortase E/protease (VPEID-CTERM system)